MIHSITVYPFDPFELGLGLNVIQISPPHLYMTFARGLREEIEEVNVADASKVQNPTKLSVFIGDLADGPDVESMFQKEALSSVVESINEREIIELQDLFSELANRLQSLMWLQDLPLTNSVGFSAKTLVNFFKPKVNYIETDSAYENISSIVDIVNALPGKKTLVTLHITSYCTKDQLICLQNELIERDLQIVDLERTDQRIDLKGIRDYFVDEDFVRFS